MEIRSAIENLGPVYSRVAAERLRKAILERIRSTDPQIRFWAEEQVNLLQSMLIEMVRVGFLGKDEAKKLVIFDWQTEELGRLVEEG